MRAFEDIFRVASTELTESIGLDVPLVVGERGAALIDSGVKPMFGQLRSLIESAVEPGRLRYIVHTHSHHDHIGCNARLQDAFGCLIVGPGHYAHWHEDFEVHYQEFARGVPALVADTAELRAEVLEILDEPRALDVRIGDGDVIDLGGGVQLEAIAVPGHMKAELAYLERSSGTLVLGDAITGLDWPIYHSHLDVPGYRVTLDRLASLLAGDAVRTVQAAHFGRMTPVETTELIGRARAYIDGVEASVIGAVTSSGSADLESIWSSVCESGGRVREFRALNMVRAHLEDLVARGLMVEAGGRYALR